MNNEINLVSPDAIGSLGNNRIHKLKTIGTFSLLAVGFLSVFLFVLNRLLSPQPIIDEKSKFNADINKLSAKQAKMVILSQRVNDSFNILNKREDYDAVLASVVGKNTDLTFASLSIEKKDISIIVTSPSLLSLNAFIDNLKDMVARKEFLKNVIVNNLSYGNSKTGYILNLSIEIL